MRKERIDALVAALEFNRAAHDAHIAVCCDPEAKPSQRSAVRSAHANAARALGIALKGVTVLEESAAMEIINERARKAHDAAHSHHACPTCGR